MCLLTVPSSWLIARFKHVASRYAVCGNKTREDSSSSLSSRQNRLKNLTTPYLQHFPHNKETKVVTKRREEMCAEQKVKVKWKKKSEQTPKQDRKKKQTREQMLKERLRAKERHKALQLVHSQQQQQQQMSSRKMTPCNRSSTKKKTKRRSSVGKVMTKRYISPASVCAARRHGAIPPSFNPVVSLQLSSTTSSSTSLCLVCVHSIHPVSSSRESTPCVVCTIK